MTENVIEHDCHGCNQSVSFIKNDIKARNIVRLVMLVSLKNDYAQVVVNLPDSLEMMNKLSVMNVLRNNPVFDVIRTNKPIGKLTEYGVVCNSCSVYFRPIEPCERCGTPSQKLTRISRFNDDLRSMPKMCDTRL